MRIKETMESVKAIPGQIKSNTILAVAAFLLAAFACAFVLIGGSVRNAH